DQKLNITGSDINHNMIKVANDNSLEAGLSDLISWKQMKVKDLYIRENNDYLVSNLPYGEHIGDKKEEEKIYNDLGVIMQNNPSWSVYILTSFTNFEKEYGKIATKKRKLFNGFIKTDYYQYFGKHTS